MTGSHRARSAAPVADDAARRGRAGYRFDLADVGYLRSEAGEQALALAEPRPLTAASLLSDITALRPVAGRHAGAVIETALLRRRAIPKFGEAAAAWLLTEAALQQGTPLPVARHRAARLAGRGVHDVTCSIGADLSAIAAVCPVAVGSDLDPVRVAMAQHNLDGDTSVFVADALRPTTTGLVIYADPARRDRAGHRITDLDTVPAVADLDEAYQSRPAVLRLPPGVDYAALNRPGEVEIVSLDGSAKEAVLWPAELAAVGRRATVLESSGPGWQLTSDDPDDAGVAPAGEWIVDPDPAVVRAGLVRHFAARHGLAQLDEHLAYLSGPLPPAATRAFRVQDVARFREQTVAGWARRDAVGTLEIKQRGTAVIPDELRRRLRPFLTKDRANAATLIIARVGDAPIAYWCRAIDNRSAG